MTDVMVKSWRTLSEPLAYISNICLLLLMYFFNLFLPFLLPLIVAFSFTVSMISQYEDMPIGRDNS